MRLLYRKRLLVLIAALALAVASGRWALPAETTPAADGRNGRRGAAISGDVARLASTVVTPHLEVPVRGSNVVWCATFQLAFNELAAEIGEPVRLLPDHPWTVVLNRQKVKRTHVDEASCVAAAGLVSDGVVERIRRELAEKFGPEASRMALPAPADGWVAFSCLRKDLEFAVAFERLKRPLRFGDADVASFGINQLLEIQQNEWRAARQVRVFDYRGAGDFIVELETRSESDQLLLAKVPPKGTLDETVSDVLRRTASSQPARLREGTDLIIPVFDFDLRRRFSELTGRTIASGSPRYRATPIALAEQRILWSLSERGARLESVAIMASGVGSELRFDKPFLIVLRRRESDQPYFVIWVANSELMVPFEP